MTEQANIPVRSGEETTGRRIKRRWVRSLYMLLLLGLGVVLGATNTQFGRDQVRDTLEKRLSAMLVDADIAIGTLEGNLLRGATARDVRLVHSSTSEMLRMDYFHVGYRLWPLLRQRVELDMVAVQGVRVHATQSPDSSWDWTTLLPPSQEEATWSIVIDSLHIERASAVARLHAATQDSLLAVHSLQGSVTGLDLPASGDAHVRSLALEAAFQPPVRMDTVRVSLDAAYTDEVIRLDTLSLISARSQVIGQGSVDLSALPLFAFQPHKPLPAETGSSLRIMMQPLAFADLTAFLPQLNEQAHLSADVRIEQVADEIDLTLGIQVDGGGTAEGAMQWQQAADGASVSGSILIDRLDLDQLTSDLLGVSPLNAELEIDLRGNAADSLSGWMQFGLGSSLVRAHRVDSTRFDAEWTKGNARARITGGFDGASITAGLSGRWLDKAPSARIEAKVTDIDAAPLMDLEGLSSDLTLAIEGTWNGKDLDSARGRLMLDVLPSRLGIEEDITGRLTMALAHGMVEWTGEMLAGAGQVTTEGTLDLRNDAPHDMRAENVLLRSQNIDLASMLSDDPNSVFPSRITASLTGSASVSAWQNGHGALELRADSLRWDDWFLAHATSRVSWEEGSGRLGVQLVPSDSSLLSLEASLALHDLGARFTTQSLAWRQFDLQSMFGPSLPVSSLTGMGSVQIDLSDPGVSHVNMRLASEASIWGAQQIKALEFQVDGTRDVLTMKGSGHFHPLLSPAQDPSRIRLDTRIDQWQKATPRATAEIAFSTLDPAALMGATDHGTSLNGRISASGRIDAGLPHHAAFALEIEPSTVRGEPVELARMEGGFADSLLSATVDIDFAEGHIKGDVALRPFDLSPSLVSTGSARRLNLLPLLGRRDLQSDVNLSWDIHGSVLDSGLAEWEVEITGEQSRMDALELERLTLRAGWDGNVLDVTELSSLLNAGTVQVNGRLNLNPAASDVYSDLRATWYAGDLNAFEGLIGLDKLASRSGTLDMQVFGPAGQLDAEVLVSVSDLEVDTWRLSSLEASSWITLDEELLPVSTTAQIDLGYVAFPTVGVRTTSFAVSQRGELFMIEGTSMVDTGNRLALDAAVNPFAKRPWVALRDMELILGGASFQLERPSNLILHEGWQLSRLTMAAPGQSLSISGGLDSTGYGLQVAFEGFNVHPIAQMMGYPVLEGRLGASMSLLGRPDAPVISSQVAMDLTEEGSDLARIMADMQSTPSGVRMVGSVVIDGEDNLVVQGFIPVFAGLGIDDAERADRAADLDVSIQSNGGSIRWIAPFVDPDVLAEMEGAVTADIKVSGSIDDPFLSGFLNLDQARFRLPELGVTYRMDHLRSSLDGITISIEEARLRSGEGAMDITGSIDFASLTNSSFDLQAQLNRFRAVRNDELHTTLSGELQLTGRTTRPDLVGRLSTSNTSFWITETAGGDVVQVPLTFDDEVMLTDNFGYRAVVADTLVDAIWKGLSLDLSMVMERDTWIRQRVNPEMAIELAGRMEIEKDRGQDDLNLYRSIEVVPDRSIIRQFGRNFRITEGVASFNGPVEEMQMQIEAEYEVPSRLNPGQPEVVITLRLDGRLDDLAFNLSSDPAMENTDIVSYIATGRPASESLQFGGTDFNNQVLVGVAASQLAGLVEGVASQSLGLDVVSIEQDGLKGTRLTAGKYVTPRLFVGVTHPLTLSNESTAFEHDERELTLEYKVLEYLLLQLLADASDSPVRLNLAGRYAY